jgi:photosystem II stability/assembly factor-like uncharacterized protein
MTPKWKIQLFSLLLSGSALFAQSPWNAVGPAGGDARSFAAVPGDPSHLYLGTTDSWLYESLDRGATWHRLSKLGATDDLILDHIVVDPTDPTLVYIAAWTVGHPDGGLWISHDRGKTWTTVEAMKGHSIRTFAQAPSNPKLLFTGSLEGVFRSTDAGATWTQISPPASQEIHEVESLAVDPVDPNIVYAGTWHLPWKTTDGGKNWHNIKQGLIDDSDVFSIIIDPAQPSVVYTSACSGIYKSENAGELYHKIQGIPTTARRTRVLKQDPVRRNIVYAGTTEGLYKSLDAGKTFELMTSPETIVNDVFVDPKDPDHVLLATDRNGVLYSKDAGESFIAANEGFSARKVEALLVDRANPAHLYAGVLNDKTFGGVFASSNGGSTWDHIGQGLDGRDVYALGQAADGAVLAGTNSGIFALDAASGGGKWTPRNTIQNTLIKKTTVLKKGKKVTVETVVPDKPMVLSSRVYALDASSDVWLASTASGLFTSKNRGASWQGGLVLGSSEYITCAAHGTQMAAARREGVVVSSDAGQTWTPTEIPSSITRIYRAAYSSDGTLWLGTREGVYLSKDLGKTWTWIERLPLKDVNDIYFDAQANKMLVSSRGSDWIFAIDLTGRDWTWTRAGWRVFLIRSAAGHLLAASLYDGVLVEPQSAWGASGQN